MKNSLWSRMMTPIRRVARRFLMLPETERGYIGPYGCIRTAAQFVTWNQVPGDYFEFGVFQGDSFAAAFHALSSIRENHQSKGFLAQSNSPDFQQWLNHRPRFVAFDSFEGLPPGAGNRHVDYQPGAYACAEDIFRRNIARQGVHLDDVVVVSGFYDQSLNEATKKTHGLSKVAVAMIDCDLYESTIPVLDFLTDLVQPGTILIFDDWFRFKGNPGQGEQRAFYEWQARNPHLQLIEYWREGPQAVSFLVNFK